MTFNGPMPGPLMVVREGDYVEVTLINPDTNSMPHNIDFHSATGALEGAGLTLVNPGEQVVLRSKSEATACHCGELTALKSIFSKMTAATLCG